jgi:CSLREA domain-containing protein
LNNNVKKWVTTIFVSLMVCGVITTRAATITVNTLNDDTIPAKDSCQLRQAIEAANTDTAVGDCAAGSGRDSIYIDVKGTILLERDLPAFTEGGRIGGTGVANLIIDGAGQYRQFSFSFGTGDYQVENLAIVNGYNETVGGCILHESNSLTLQRVRLNGCESGGVGGAIYITTSNISGGRVTAIEESTFIGNSATGNGGAILFSNFTGNGSILDISNTTFFPIVQMGRPPMVVPSPSRQKTPTASPSSEVRLMTIRPTVMAVRFIFHRLPSPPSGTAPSVVTVLMPMKAVREMGHWQCKSAA